MCDCLDIYMRLRVKLNPAVVAEWFKACVKFKLAFTETQVRIQLEACLYGTIFGPAVDCWQNMVSIVQKWKHFVAIQTAERRVA